MNWSKSRLLIVVKWSKFALKKNSVCQKHYKIRVSVLIFINWSKLAFVLDPKLEPVSGPYLDQLITIKHGNVLLFGF